MSTNGEGGFKQASNINESRRQREEYRVQLRKNRRRQQLRSKRKISTQKDGESKESLGNTEERLKQLPQHARDLLSNDLDTQLTAARAIRRLLAVERDPPIAEIIKQREIVPRLAQFLKDGEKSQLQFEAAWALTNIASGNREQTGVVVQAGCIATFVELMGAENPHIVEQAVWALGNIAGDCVEFRDRVLKCGAVDRILNLFPSHRLTLVANATWTMSNLCRGKPQPDFREVRRFMPLLISLLQEVSTEETLTDACWAVSYLTDDSDKQPERIQRVLECRGAATRLVELLQSKHISVLTPALRIVGNIVTGSDMQTDIMIANGVLPQLLSLLTYNARGVRKEACWTLSNITAGTQEQIQKVFDEGIIPTLVMLLQNDDFEIQKEAAWAISNATSGGSVEQIRELVAQRVIPPLVNLLQYQDKRITVVCLEGLENILRVGRSDQHLGLTAENKMAKAVEVAKGLDQLELLQHHDSQHIHEKALSIMEEYYELDDVTVVDEGDPPVEDSNQQFQWNAGGDSGFGGGGGNQGMGGMNQGGNGNDNSGGGQQGGFGGQQGGFGGGGGGGGSSSSSNGGGSGFGGFGGDDGGFGSGGNDGGGGNFAFNYGDGNSSFNGNGGFGNGGQNNNNNNDNNNGGSSSMGENNFNF